MKPSLQNLSLLFLLIVSFGGPISLLAGDWPMYAHDAQRSGWQSQEKDGSKQRVRSFKLKWETKVQNESKLLNALTAPVVAADVKTDQRELSLVYLAGSSNNFYALNAETGDVVWQRVFKSDVLPVVGGLQGTVYCPLSLNATPLVDRATGTVYAIAGDGRLFGMNLATGVDKFQPMPFVPAFSKNWSLNISDGIIYTSLAQGCGHAPSGIYSMDIRNPRRPRIRELLTSVSDSAGIWGRGGPVIGANHKMYGVTADGIFNPSNGEFGISIIAASLPDLKLVDYFSPPNHEGLTKRDLDFSASSPVWFSYGGYDLVVAGGKEGVLYLLDANSLGGRDHQTALFTTPPLGNDAAVSNSRGIWGALTYWQDDSGQPWIYVPIWGPESQRAPKFPLTNGPHPHGCIMAFKVDLDRVSKKPILDPAWISGDFNLPDPPAIEDGVLFALSTGENADQATNRESNGHAVLFALDAKTGKVLYESGDSIKGWVHFSGLAISNGLVYAVDHDSRVYCFGPSKD